jgi:hypothetical protein
VKGDCYIIRKKDKLFMNLSFSSLPSLGRSWNLFQNCNFGFDELVVFNVKIDSASLNTFDVTGLCNVNI